MYALLTVDSEDSINQLFDNIQKIDENTAGQYLVKFFSLFNKKKSITV